MVSGKQSGLEDTGEETVPQVARPVSPVAGTRLPDESANNSMFVRLREHMQRGSQPVRPVQAELDSFSRPPYLTGFPTTGATRKAELKKGEGREGGAEARRGTGRPPLRGRDDQVLKPPVHPGPKPPPLKEYPPPSHRPFYVPGEAPLLTEEERRLLSVVDDPAKHTRYQLQGVELGRGGMGRVIQAYDRLLLREVALKLPLPEVEQEPGLLAMLRDESRLTARLEHPSIVPVYDLVTTPEGKYGYVMRKVDGERLSEALKGLQEGDPTRVEAYGRVRLLTIFLQVVTAVACAHDSRIIHRDLKPNNIMLGKYGQVLLLDWGLAMNLDSRTPELLAGDPGGFVGAPAYISPEQMLGDVSKIDERSDIYSLGAILYELLTLSPPFLRRPGEDDDTFLARIQRGEIPLPSELVPDRKIPPALQEICFKCLSRQPEDRYQTAMELHHDLTLFLEGTREAEWRRRAAEAKVREAEIIAGRYEVLNAEALSKAQESHELRRAVQPWEDLDHKRPLWDLQRQADERQKAAMQEFNDAEKAFLQAIGHEQGFVPAMEGLSKLYLRRFLHAEAGGNLSEMRYFEARTQAFDINGRYTQFLKGDGSVSLQSSPPGAHVTLYSYEEQDRILRPVQPRDCGPAPVHVTLPVGSHLALLSMPGYRDVLFPLSIGRLERIDAVVNLFTEEELGEEYVYIPAGNFRMGGDPEAYSLELETRYVADFAIGRLPVTVAEYLEFINALAERDPEAASRHIPRADENPRPQWDLGPDGRYHLPERPDGDGHVWSMQMPILNVSCDDALAYMAWRSERDGRPYRLPSCAEWEKAARGTDGRLFPWGDVWEATYCKNRDSKKAHAFPEIVGQYPQDVSPYGVMDLAGGVCEWTSDVYNRGEGLSIVKGGNWTMGERACRIARNLVFRSASTNLALGFRLCFSLTKA